MSEQGPCLVGHACHWYAYEVGVCSQRPTCACSGLPGPIAPVTEGRTAIVGADGPEPCWVTSTSATTTPNATTAAMRSRVREAVATMVALGQPAGTGWP